MSTTTVITTKTLRTTAKAGAIKITKITTTIIAREEVSKEEAASLAPGTATVTASTCTVKGENPTTTATAATTATFREGKNGVSFFLMDITHAERDIRRMEDNLIEHVKDTIRILETRSGKTIELMYIGKTHCDVDKRKKKPSFDRLNHENWTLSGINCRWTRHQKNPKVPSDGMVVLCAFTKHDLPTAGSRRSQEYLALAMEQRLIQRFQIEDTEKIVVNEEFKPGGTTRHTKDASRELSVSVLSENSDLDLTDNPIPPEPTYCAYVVYMTYSYLPPEKKWKDLRKKQKIALEKQREEQEKRLKKPKDKDESDTDSGEDEATAKDDSVQDEESLLDEESVTSPLFHSTPISSPTSALSSKENIQPLSSPLSTVKRDLLPALLQTV